MARAKSETGPALAAGYAELVKRGAAVTVRSLREAAGVSTAASAEWLRANRPAQDTPPVPGDELAGAVGALWAVAVAAARDEVATDATAREADLVTAEAAALEQLTQSEAARTELTEHLERTGADAERAAQHARDEITGLQQQLAQASADARQEREAARNAEARAARAEATAETLQRLVDQHFTTPPAPATT